jgi:hypothetical protein
MEPEALQAALPDIQRLDARLPAISEKYGRTVHRRVNVGFDEQLRAKS